MASELSEYDRWHSAHETGQGSWYEMAHGLIQEHGLVMPGDRVIEVGCGQGRFARWMRTRGAHVIGEDFSPTAIESARELDPDGDYRVGDIERLEHPDNSFDVVVSCEVIEHVFHPQKAVSELARVLKPGGTLILSTPNYLSPTGLTRLAAVIRGRKWDEGGQPHVNWTMWPRTAHWVKRTGLAIYATRGDIWAFPYPGRAEGLRWNPSPTLRPYVERSALHIVLLAR